MSSTTLYCSCETPVMDVDYDAGCRRCGLPVNFSPKRYAVRRTLLVRPENYGTLQGTDYGCYSDLDEAIRVARRHTNLGYPSRVVDTAEGRAVWVRPGTPSMRADSYNRLPCGCPIDSGCDGYHSVTPA